MHQRSQLVGAMGIDCKFGRFRVPLGISITAGSVAARVDRACWEPGVPRPIADLWFCEVRPSLNLRPKFSKSVVHGWKSWTSKII